MSVNIAQLKKQLQDLGISTNTPGLLGDDRYEELRSRLDAHNAANSTSPSKAKVEDPSSAMPSLSHLSIGEIRSRLTDLGESTNTPGLSGDERRFELMRRLINAICGAEEEAVAVVAEPAKPFKPKKPVSKPEPVVEPVIVKAPELAPPMPIVEEVVVPDNSVPLEDISELKNELKRLVNKRAMAVAAKLSGPHQDAELKALDLKVNKIDAELSTLKTIKAKTDIRLHIDKFLSEFVHLDVHNGRNPDNYIVKLEALRSHVKDQVRDRRLAVREEADNSPEFGIAVEEKLKIILSSANLNNLNTTKHQSKARQKLNASKELESKLNAVAPLTTTATATTAAGKSGNPGTYSGAAAAATAVEGGAAMGAAYAALALHQPSHHSKGSSQHHDKPSSANERINDIVKHELSAIKHAKVSAQPIISPSKPEPADPFKSAFLDITMDIDEVMAGKKSRDSSNNTSPEKAVNQDVNSPLMKAALAAAEKAPPTKGTAHKPTAAAPAATTSNNTEPAARTFKHDARVDSDSNSEDHADSSDDENDDGHARRRGEKGGRQDSKKHAKEGAIHRTSSKDEVGPHSHEKHSVKPTAAAAAPSAGRVRPSLSSDSRDDDPVKQTGGEGPSTSKKVIGPPPARGAPIDTRNPPSHAAAAMSGPSGGSVKVAGPPPPVHNTSNKAIGKAPLGSGPPVGAPPSAAVGPTSTSSKNKPSDAPSDEEDQSEGDSDSDGSDGDDALLRSQIRQHHADAKNYESLHDFIAAEQHYSEALALDPTNIVSLQLFALFLHQKKGELARAEAFFNRGLQMILPGFDIHYLTSPMNKPTEEGFPLTNSPKVVPTTAASTSPAKLPTHAPPSSSGVKIKYIIRFILSFASFLTKSSGDIEGAYALYRKALELDSNNPMCMGIFAHFLSQECSSSNGPASINTKNNSDEAIELFKKALLLQPRNVLTTMWYAKLLKKLKRFGEAELLYKVAVENSSGQFRLEPTAICNYATFIYKQRKNPVKAQEMFVEGLARFPTHKGLIKNYCTLLRVYTNLGSAEEVRKKLLTADKTSETAALRATQILNSINNAASLTGDEDSDLNPNLSNGSGDGGGGGGLESPKKGGAPSTSTNSNSLENELADDEEGGEEEGEDEVMFGDPVHLNIGIPPDMEDGSELLNAKLMARVKGTPVVGSPLPSGLMSPTGLAPWSGRDDKKLFFSASYEGTPTNQHHDESISKMARGGNAIIDAKTGKPLKLMRTNTSESTHSMNVKRGVSPGAEGERYVDDDTPEGVEQMGEEVRDPDYYSGDEID